VGDSPSQGQDAKPQHCSSAPFTDFSLNALQIAAAGNKTDETPSPIRFVCSNPHSNSLSGKIRFAYGRGGGEFMLQKKPGAED
jgi:hypothetical protein